VWAQGGGGARVLRGLGKEAPACRLPLTLYNEASLNGAGSPWVWGWPPLNSCSIYCCKRTCRNTE